MSGRFDICAGVSSGAAASLSASIVRPGSGAPTTGCTGSSRSPRRSRGRGSPPGNHVRPCKHGPPEAGRSACPGSRGRIQLINHGTKVVPARSPKGVQTASATAMALLTSQVFETPAAPSTQCGCIQPKAGNAPPGVPNRSSTQGHERRFRLTFHRPDDRLPGEPESQSRSGRSVGRQTAEPFVEVSREDPTRGSPLT